MTDAAEPAEVTLGLMPGTAGLQARLMSHERTLRPAVLKRS